jgi:hypothetical protein
LFENVPLGSDLISATNIPYRLFAISITSEEEKVEIDKFFAVKESMASR